MIVFFHTVQIQFQPDCKFNKGIGVLLSVNAALFIYMFSAFYVKSYRKKSETIRPPEKEEQLQHSKLTAEAGSGGGGGLQGYIDDFDFDNNNNSSRRHEKGAKKLD